VFIVIAYLLSMFEAGASSVNLVETIINN